MLLLNETKQGRPEVFGSPIPRNRENYEAFIDYKAAAFRATKDEADFEYKARSVFDPKLRRYRCPPGTRHGGRITNRMGAGCGGNIVRRLIGAARRAGRAVDTPNASGTRQATKPSRTARTARRAGRQGGRGVRGAVGRAGEAYQASGRVQLAANAVNPYTSSPARSARLGKLNAFGRALARLAERADVDDAELTDIAKRTGIPKEQLTPERRERLGGIGQRMNALLNQWADRVDVDLEDVDDLAERTDGAADEARNALRNRRERRGIAQRERQINRRRRIDEFARRVDVDEDASNLPEKDNDDYLATGGRMRNPERRRINRAFIDAVRPDQLNDDKRDRLYDAAAAEYLGLQDFWSRRLGNRDFTLNDINRHIRNHEKNPDDEAGVDALKALRDDWAELRPFFDPIDNEFEGDLGQVDVVEVVGALARLDSDRKFRILEAAELDRTEALADLDKAQNDMEKAAIAVIENERLKITQWEEALRRGAMTEDARQRLLMMHGELAQMEDSLKRKRDIAQQALADFDKKPEGNQVERKKLEAAYRLASIRLAGVQGNRQGLTELRRKYPQLGQVITSGNQDDWIPPLFEDVGPEGTFVLGEPAPLPSYAGSMGRVDEKGFPELKVIENPNIQTREQAVEHIKKGGSMNEVPNQFWFDAMDENASSDPADTSARFHAIRPHQGAMGDTYLFIAKDENGEPNGRGWVVKAQHEKVNVSELMGWVVAEMAGVGAGMPGWDGKKSGWDQKLILPIGNNMGPAGDIVKDQEGIFDIRQLKELSDAGAPARVTNAMVAYLAAARDRKDANAYSFVVGDKGYALPLDYGLAFHPDIANKDFARYIEGTLGEDYRMMDDLNEHLDKLWNKDGAKAVEQAEAIIDTYDKILANARRLRNMEPEEWRERVKKGQQVDPNVRADQYEPDMEQGFQMALNQLEQLESARNSFLKKVIPADIHKEIRQKRLAEEARKADEALKVTNEADRQAKWKGNQLTPQNEVDIDFSIDTPGKAGEHLRNGGDLAVIPDQVYVRGMLQAGTLTNNRDGKEVDIDNFLNAHRMPTNMSNERFNFKQIKNAVMWNTPWTVYQVDDKTTGKRYFMKAGVYGNTEALNEVVGAEIQRIMGFDHDDKAGVARVGELTSHDGREQYRWAVVPHVADYNSIEKDRGRWAEIASGAHHRGEINDNDIARFAVMDYLINNQDRHTGNLMIAGPKGNKRIIPIDQGLMGFGRREGHMGVHDENFERGADIWADITPEQYRENALNNPFKKWLNTREALNSDQRDRVLRRIEAIVKQLEKMNADDFFNAGRLGRRGIDWSPTEEQHIEAMKRIFTARLERLRRDPSLMGAAIR